MIDDVYKINNEKIKYLVLKTLQQNMIDTLNEQSSNKSIMKHAYIDLFIKHRFRFIYLFKGDVFMPLTDDDYYKKLNYLLYFSYEQTSPVELYMSECIFNKDSTYNNLWYNQPSITNMLLMAPSDDFIGELDSLFIVNDDLKFSPYYIEMNINDMINYLNLSFNVGLK